MGRMVFQRLPLLESLVQTRAPVIEAKFSNTLLVAVQHLLETTGSLFEVLLRLGLRPENTFVLGKAYSSNRKVADRLRACGVSVEHGSLPTRPGGFQDAFRGDVACLWNRVLDVLRTSNCTDVVILDDGGRCISMVPQEVHALARVSGVEQTTGGLVYDSGSPGFRVIEVATSAAKRILESPMISRAVLRRLPPFVRTGCCGVIGVGNVGSRVISHLLESGREVLTFDRDPSRSRAFPAARTVDSLAELIRGSEIVFGCSGDDVFAGHPTIEWRDGETTLTSCSSEDREFRSLLADASATGCLKQWTALGVGIIEQGNSRMKILRGGFPLNFDGSSESVPAREIQLTRALLLGGVLQAALCGDGASPEGGSGRMLDPRFQAKAAREWFRMRLAHRADFSLEVVDGSDSEDWIAERSGGSPEDTAAMQTALDLR